MVFGVLLIAGAICFYGILIIPVFSTLRCFNLADEDYDFECSKKMFVCILIMSPFIIILFCIAAVFTVALAGLMLVPAYLLHFYFFIRIHYWWCKSKDSKDIKSEVESSFKPE